MAKVEISELTPQRASGGKYEGPYLFERYRVLGSVLRGYFFVADCIKAEAVRGRDGLVQHWGSIEEAENEIARLSNEPPLHDLTAAKAAPKGSMAAKPAAAAKEPKAPTASKEPKATAAGLFRELILAGKLTDDQIFAQVQQAFGLPDSRRSYVDWYRKDLVKQGKLPKS